MDQDNWLLKIMNGFNIFLIVITAIIGYMIYQASSKTAIIVLSVIVGLILSLIITLSLLIRFTTKKNPKITEDQISSLFGKKTIVNKKKKENQ